MTIEPMRDQRGQALIELSVSILILFMVVFGITEFGRYFYYANTANNAARAGARWAVTHPAASGWCTDVQNYVVSNYSSQFNPALSSGDIAVAPCPSAQPATGTAVQVTVTKAFTILSGTIIPFFSGSKTISGSASMRYEL